YRVVASPRFNRRSLAREQRPRMSGVPACAGCGAYLERASESCPDILLTSRFLQATLTIQNGLSALRRPSSEDVTHGGAPGSRVRHLGTLQHGAGGVIRTPPALSMDRCRQRDIPYSP